jgi:hypothetical protein
MGRSVQGFFVSVTQEERGYERMTISDIKETLKLSPFAEDLDDKEIGEIAKNIFLYRSSSPELEATA